MYLLLKKNGSKLSEVSEPKLCTKTDIVHYKKLNPFEIFNVCLWLIGVKRNRNDSEHWA